MVAVEVHPDRSLRASVVVLRADWPINVAHPSEYCYGPRPSDTLVFVYALEFSEMLSRYVLCRELTCYESSCFVIAATFECVLV